MSLSKPLAALRFTCSRSRVVLTVRAIAWFLEARERSTMFLSGEELALLLMTRTGTGFCGFENKPQSLRRCFRDKDLFAMPRSRFGTVQGCSWSIEKP